LPWLLLLLPWLSAVQECTPKSAREAIKLAGNRQIQNQEHCSDQNHSTCDFHRFTSKPFKPSRKTSRFASARLRSTRAAPQLWQFQTAKSFKRPKLLA
jgi:hypothetical protein